MGMLGYLILISLELYNFNSLFSPSKEEKKIYQTLKTVFDQISKYLAVHQIYSTGCDIFNALLGVWKYGQTWSL